MNNKNVNVPYTALIAIDWADKEHQVCLWAENHPRSYHILEQNPQAIIEWVANLQRDFSGKVAIAVEQTKGPLIYALMGYAFIDLYPINTATLGRFRSAFSPSGAKDDKLDVDYLMDILMTHRKHLRVWLADDETTRSLRIYAEARKGLVHQIQALINYIRALLKGYYPQALALVGELASPMAWAFLSRWPTLSKLGKVKPMTLRNFYYAHGSRSAKLIDQRIGLIEKAVPLTTDPTIVETSEQILLHKLNHIQVLHRSIVAYDKKLKKLFQKHEDAQIFSSFPGAGEALAPRLAAVIGSQRDRYENAKNLQQYSGIAPVVRSSGTEKRKASKLSQRRKKRGSEVVQRRRCCPKFVLQTFHEFAGCSIPYCPWAKAYFQQQKDKGASHHQAIRALAFKWQRIIYRCWKDRQKYDDNKYLAALRKRGSTLIPRINLIVQKKCA